jgi:hypothetical protein
MRATRDIPLFRLRRAQLAQAIALSSLRGRLSIGALLMTNQNQFSSEIVISQLKRASQAYH